jgi:hypothetical protein
MIKNIRKNAGFVLLYAVTLSAILLSIALGVSQIAFKENTFGTSARETNEAFFAADTGVECALFYDNGDATKNAFTGGAQFVGPMTCVGATITLPLSSPKWTFSVFGLGSTAQGCAEVTMDKTKINDPINPITSVTAEGYSSGKNVGGDCTPGAGAVARELNSNY